MSDKGEVIYRVQYHHAEIQYDIYVRHVYPSDMPGFICIEGFLFQEETQLLIDPRMEKLSHEFANVETAFIPYHQIIRIDQVSKAGESQTKTLEKNDKIKAFPRFV
ncbi:DUF1820 family protein [Suttonella sp. R2A3]|uniref:DUF1820 family protein n=1 Tax=Suttonella sp. R2A3 TaxID=2908648 RepID=UPI001F30D898|nr:DUF1820 family protein [Suttonella sp. R2A3]UJF23945.1 DUF1820 family protein [Suttonella sp. R2A3]